MVLHERQGSVLTNQMLSEELRNNILIVERNRGRTGLYHNHDDNGKTI
jgi:hypothetical protein